MTTLLVVLGGFFTALALAGIWALTRIRDTITITPPPATIAKIEADSADIAARIDAQAAADTQEVASADRKALLARARLKLVRK